MFDLMLNPILFLITSTSLPSLVLTLAAVFVVALGAMPGFSDAVLRCVSSPNRSSKTKRSVGWVNKTKFIFGHLGSIQQDPVGFASRELEGAGADRPATTLWMLHKPSCWIMDPALAKAVLSAKFTLKESTRNLLLPTWHLMFGRGLFMVDGETWKRQHRIAIRSFGSAQTRDFVPIVERITERFVDLLPSALSATSGHAVPMIPERHFSPLALEIICTIAFGNGGEDGSILDIFKRFEKNWEYGARFGALQVVPGFIDLPIAANREMKANVEAMHMVCRRLVAEYRRTGKTGKVEGTSLLKVLCDAADGSDQLSDDEVVHNVFSFMAAGMDTTSTTLSHLVCCLASNPDVQDRLYDEMARYERCDVDGAPVGSEFDLVAARENLYLSQVIKESMRLFPALLGSAPRIAKQDMDLVVDGDRGRPGETATSSEAIRIRKGQVFNVSSLLMHRNPNVWGKDAAEFRPDRHGPAVPSSPGPALGETKDGGLGGGGGGDLRFVNGAYDFNSFGGGVRPCIGRHLSLLELRTATALLVRRFAFVHTAEGRKRLRADGSHPCVALFPVLKVPKDFPVGIKLRQRRQPTGA